jgi:hypothetical protein
MQAEVEEAREQRDTLTPDWKYGWLSKKGQEESSSWWRKMLSGISLPKD